MKTLEITSYIGCPNLCSYCPQEKLMGEYSGRVRMSIHDFKALLKNVPKDVRIDFSGFSEIFFNREGSQMIRYAYDQNYLVVLYTTLEGIKYPDIELLKGIQFTDLCFHKYPGVNIDRFNNWVQIFEQEVSKGRVAVIDDKNKWSRAGNVWDTETKLGPLRCLFAEKLFDHNVVLPNGDVYLCCNDYGLKHNIGNLFTTHYDKLNREDYTMMSNDYDSDLLCRKCELSQNV